MHLQPEATTYYERADQRAARRQRHARVRNGDWSDDTLAWKARAALRADDGARARLAAAVHAAIDAMSAAEQRDPTWVYWKARALQAIGRRRRRWRAATRPQAQRCSSGIASPLHFYGKLAAEDLGQPLDAAAAAGAARRADENGAAANDMPASRARCS